MTNMIHRVSIGVVFLLLAGGAGLAQNEFPDQTITIICNWPAGGGQDEVSRLIAKFASEKAGVPVVVKNVTGDAGAAGVKVASEAKADGYTVGIIGSSFVARIYSNPTAIELNEIDPLVFFGPDPGALSVRADTGIRNLKQYFEKLKSDPGSLKNGTDPPGGSSAIVASFIEDSFNVNMSQVPYEAYEAAKAAMLSGEVQSATLPVPIVSEEHQSGAVRILGVTSAQRHFKAPDVPTFSEQGYDLIAGDWRALFLPKGVPYGKRMLLEDLFLNTLRDPDFQQAAREAGYIVTPMDSVDTKIRIMEYDTDVYPILLKAGLVTQREK